MCLKDFVHGNIQSCLEFKQLSHVVLDNFKPMIPAKFSNELWKMVIDHNDINLKLCGSGGGGIFLF